MITTIITLLIYICVLALVVYLIIWVLGVIGVALPPKVIQILWVIVALIGMPRIGKLSTTPPIVQLHA